MAVEDKSIFLIDVWHSAQDDLKKVVKELEIEYKAVSLFHVGKLK